MATSAPVGDIPINNAVSWNIELDKRLEDLVTDCSFDFEKIAVQMSNEFNSAIITKSECQLRWRDIHAQRKAKKAAKKEAKEIAELKGNISQSSINKKSNLQEIIDKLPQKKGKN